MATKIIKAWIDGTIQNIEVEDIISPEQPLSVEERVDKLEDKHEVVFADGNFLVGNGTEELEEMTPEEVLSHINGASVATMTTAEFEALEESNANTLYLLTDSEDEGSTSGGTSSDTSGGITDAVRYDTIQMLNADQKKLARYNTMSSGFDDIYKTETSLYFDWDGNIDGKDTITIGNSTYCKISDNAPDFESIYNAVSEMTDGKTNNYLKLHINFYEAGNGFVVEQAGTCYFSDADNTNFVAPSKGIYFLYSNDGDTNIYQKSLELSASGVVTLSYTWDGNIEDKDTFIYNSCNYYKISNDIFDYKMISGVSSKFNNANSYDCHYHNGINCYCVGSAIIVTQAGLCELEVNYRDLNKLTFTAPSTGIYFLKISELSYLSELNLLVNGKHGIYLNSTTNSFVVGVTNDGAITTENSDGTVIEMAKKAYVDEQIAAIDIELDTTLTVAGKAADAHSTGEAVYELYRLIGDSPVSEQIAEAVEEVITEVYAQDDEPVDAPEGSIWIDTDADGAPSTSGKISANVYVVDARTADMTTVDFSQYKIGDVVLVTTS